VPDCYYYCLFFLLLLFLLLLFLLFILYSSLLIPAQVERGQVPLTTIETSKFSDTPYLVELPGGGEGAAAGERRPFEGDEACGPPGSIGRTILVAAQVCLPRLFPSCPRGVFRRLPLQLVSCCPLPIRPPIPR
jgi:hypothetical protein